MAATRALSLLRIATRARVPAIQSRGLRKSQWSAAIPTSFADSPTAAFVARRGIVIPPKRAGTHSVITNHGRQWCSTKPTSFFDEPDSPTTTSSTRSFTGDAVDGAAGAGVDAAAAGDTDAPSAQLQHEYSNHAEPAKTLSAEDLSEAIRAGSTPDAALLQIKVLEWVASGTITPDEGCKLIDALSDEREARRLGARAVLMRHGGDEATAAAAATDDAAGLTDEAVAGLSEDQVRLLAAWSHAPATDAEAAERRVLESQEQPAPAMEGEEGGNGSINVDVPTLDRLLWGEPSVYPAAPEPEPEAGKQGKQAASRGGARAAAQGLDDGLKELLTIAAAPLAVGAVTILGSLLIGRPLK